MIKYILIFLPFLFSACTQSNISRNIILSPDISFTLPSSKYITETHQASQIVSGSYDGHDFNIQIEVESSPNKLVIVGLGPWGKQLFSAVYENDKISLTSLPSPVKQIPPQYILADILFTTLDYNSLSQALKDTNITCQISQQKRLFYANKNLIITIEYSNSNPWQGTIKLKNLIRNYKISIKNIEIE